MDKEYANFHFRPLREAQQDAMKEVKEGDRNVAKNYIERLARLFGAPTGEIDINRDETIPY